VHSGFPADRAVSPALSSTIPLAAFIRRSILETTSRKRPHRDSLEVAHTGTLTITNRTVPQATDAPILLVMESQIVRRVRLPKVPGRSQAVKGE
jgi:hypothetical protein